jgi:hypothetical protein
MLTIAQVETKVAEIKALADAGDYLRAALAEEALYERVMEAIASDELPRGEAATMAEIAFKTGDLDFPR